MRIHRVFTSQDLEPGQSLQLAERAAHYLGRVLRVAVGETVVLFNGDGHDYVTDVVSASKKTLDLAVRSRIPARRESHLKVTVVQALGRGERMDYTLQKCTELGAAAFQPLFSERVELKLKADKLEKRLEHWRGVVISACEQSGRAVVPEVEQPLSLRDWLARKSSCRRFVLDPVADGGISSAEIPGQLELAIGPEGGFSDAERDWMAASGVKPLTLGPRILRTETAGPAALAVLQAVAGDF